MPFPARRETRSIPAGARAGSATYSPPPRPPASSPASVFSRSKYFSHLTRQSRDNVTTSNNNNKQSKYKKLHVESVAAIAHIACMIWSFPANKSHVLRIHNFKFFFMTVVQTHTRAHTHACTRTQSLHTTLRMRNIWNAHRTKLFAVATFKSIINARADTEATSTWNSVRNLRKNPTN